MPRKKKTEEAPIPSNVELSSTDSATEVEETTADTAANEANPSLAETPEQDTTVQKEEEAPDNEKVDDAIEVTESEVNSDTVEDEPLKDSVGEDIASTDADETFGEEDPDDNNFVLNAEEMLEEYEAAEEGSAELTDKSEDHAEFFEDDLEDDIEAENSSAKYAQELKEVQDQRDERANPATPPKNETTANLAEKLMTMRKQRVSTVSSTASDTANDADRDTVSQSDSRIEEARTFFGFGAQREEVDNSENMIWAELSQFKFSGIAITCRVVGATVIDKEVYAICMPSEEKQTRLKNVKIYVPFSEMDYVAGSDISDERKLVLISKISLNCLVRVSIIELDKNRGVIGSIKKGNMTTRRRAYFRGVRKRNSRTGELIMQVIGNGTTVNDAFVERLTLDGIYVNIYGAHTFIPISELAHEYLEHPREKFKIGQKTKVKVLEVQTDEKNNYGVKVVAASVKALEPNLTVEALNEAQYDTEYIAKIKKMPSKRSKLIIASSLSGFNCIIGNSQTDQPFTRGSEVIIKLITKNKEYGYGFITRVTEFAPKHIQ